VLDDVFMMSGGDRSQMIDSGEIDRLKLRGPHPLPVT
jgi:hypothetical protein